MVEGMKHNNFLVETNGIFGRKDVSLTWIKIFFTGFPQIIKGSCLPLSTRFQDYPPGRSLEKNIHSILSLHLPNGNWAAIYPFVLKANTLVHPTVKVSSVMNQCVNRLPSWCQDFCKYHFIFTRWYCFLIFGQDSFRCADFLPEISAKKVLTELFYVFVHAKYLLLSLCKGYKFLKLHYCHSTRLYCRQEIFTRKMRKMRKMRKK